MCTLVGCAHIVFSRHMFWRCRGWRFPVVGSWGHQFPGDAGKSGRRGRKTMECEDETSHVFHSRGCHDGNCWNGESNCQVRWAVRKEGRPVLSAWDFFALEPCCPHPAWLHPHLHSLMGMGSGDSALGGSAQPPTEEPWTQGHSGVAMDRRLLSSAAFRLHLRMHFWLPR